MRGDRAPRQVGWVDIAPNPPGDVHVVELDGSVGWCVTKGSWLASAAGVNLGTRWGGLRNLFGGDGGFRPISQGMMQSMKSGEGLVFDFAGPGRVLTQTRNPGGLIGWLQANGLGTRA